MDDLSPIEPDGVAGPNRGSYASPLWLTQPGQADRRAEARHALAMRDAHREVERARLNIAKKLAIEVAEIDADSRSLSEKKYQLHRAQTESRVLAGDDQELQVKFAVMDDDFFHHLRVRTLRGRP